MTKYNWFKHGDHIRRRRARKEHLCSLCEKVIKRRELYVSITGLNDDYRFSAVKVCLDCFYSKNWADTLNHEIIIANRFEVHD